MASNQKLTKILAGRDVAGSTQAEGLLTVTFADGSTMRIKTGAPTAAAAAPPTGAPATDAPAEHPTNVTPTAPTTGTTVPAPTSPAAGAPVTPGKKVKKVRQKGTELDLDFEDGTTWTIQTAEATSSVILRDKAGKLEYAD